MMPVAVALFVVVRPGAPINHGPVTVADSRGWGTLRVWWDQSLAEGGYVISERDPRRSGRATPGEIREHRRLLHFQKRLHGLLERLDDSVVELEGWDEFFMEV